jgi:signal transduction histidine kinase/CheY-like chemotaxis protein
VRPEPRSLLDHREYPVLYVDDEPENLRIFELTFKRKFSILTAESGEEGLRLLSLNPVAIVLSDHRMPGMSGVEFLSRVRDVDEKTIRILVTAYGDAETLGHAINDGRIYRYLAKPWDPDEMRITVRRAIEHYALDRERDVLVNELSQLNRLSHSLHRELDVDILAQMLIDTLEVEMDFDGVTLLFFDAEGERLSWKGFSPNRGEVTEKLRSISINSSNARRFLTRMRKGETQVLRVEELADLEAPIREWVTEVSADEIVVVPLIGRKRPIGALAVDNRSGGRSFGSDDRTLLDGIAIQAVIAFENARLVEDLRRSREQVLRADRLGTLGTLAAGMAHEINNPLVSIHTFLSLAPAKRAEDDGEFWGDYHALASRELERIRGLVATMSQLAKGQRGEVTFQQVDLCDLAARVVALMQREAQAAQVELSLEADPETPSIAAVPDHLHQVFLNLILNAVQASSQGGRVSMVVGPDPDRPEQGTCVRVEDSGEGIPEENMERVFDPFFTTKDPDGGTGLGLMISHEIVADHGGTIEVSSRGGEGSSFLVRLPTRPPVSGKGSSL